MEKGVVYQATITTLEDNSIMKYIGSASTTFKDRLYNHRSLILNIEKRHQTALSTYAWDKKDEGKTPVVNYELLTKAAPYTSATGKCQLCLQEKVNILLADKSSALNKRSEISAKCRHRHRWTLAGWKPGIT